LTEFSGLVSFTCVAFSQLKKPSNLIFNLLVTQDERVERSEDDPMKPPGEPSTLLGVFNLFSVNSRLSSIGSLFGRKRIPDELQIAKAQVFLAG
jgi:hypothetical protein